MPRAPTAGGGVRGPGVPDHLLGMEPQLEAMQQAPVGVALEAH